MFNAIRTKPASPFFAAAAATTHKFAGKVSPVIGTVRLHQVAPGTGPTNNNPRPANMDKIQNPKDSASKSQNVMEHSFGEGYATRSDEEGFGGVYGGNQSLPKQDEEKIIHANSPEYDNEQGSEVKEKEKARHQTHANS